MKIETKLLHAGIEPDSSTGAIMTPIYQTTTFVHQSDTGDNTYSYSRTSNPTRSALEKNLAAIENAKFGITFGSGMAAIDAVLRLLNPEDEVIVTQDLYGGTYRLFTSVYAKYEIKFVFVDMLDVENIRRVITSKTKMIWVETPTNPMMSILDIRKIAKVGSSQILLAVDNTFASPYLQNPIDLGADLVMHSVTKYLAGHSDVVMGALMTNHTKLAQELYRIQNSTGAIPGPQDCFLALRGIKTLHVRMDRHCQNAQKIAEFLSKHEKVKEVYYPGLPSHKNHHVAQSQMRGFGGMISFSLKEDSIESAQRVLKRTKLFSLAESLGGVESLIGHPATMTHGSIPRETRIKSGISDSLIRVSVGIEQVEDLIEDLEKSIN
jgi:cystathionine beta-lyase